MRVILGFTLAFLIGVMCRVIRIPSPAPQALLGSLLVVTMSLGYITAERWLQVHQTTVSSPAAQQTQDSIPIEENNHASNRV